VTQLPPFLRYAIGIGIPFLSVIPTVPLLNRLPIAFWGVPVGIWWLFACIPLASLCLSICWFAQDRHRPEEHIETDYDGGRS
jgi:hypothetical protein